MSTSAPEGTKAISERHRFDVEALRRWIDAHVAPMPGPLFVRQSRGGQSNPTFWISDGERELGRATVPAPGGGAEVTAEFRVTPARPGLAVWTARVDSANSG